MEKRVSRAENKLSAYAKRTGMSEAGKHWLIAAIDPFHDKPLNINGYPDGTPGKSLVQLIKLSREISKPASLPAGATWDCLINTDNFLNGNSLLPFVNTGGIYQPTTVVAPGYVSTVCGGLSIRLAQSGVPLNGSTGNATFEYRPLFVGNEFFEGKLRVLSLGFEVANTTSELYKNGSVTVFELPQEHPSETFTVPFGNMTGSTIPTAAAGSASLLRCNRMPSTLAEATQTTGSQTWEAKEGCYVVARQNGLSNPAVAPKQVSPALVYADSSVPFPSGASPVYTRCMQSGAVYSTNDSFAIPFHSKGAYFSNLNENTTLRVNYNVWIERFPSVTEINFLSLATESCDYDPVALEAWATINSEAPVGVMFKENGLGDWFTGQIASLIDHWTGTTIASDVDKWQKNYALGAQSNENMGMMKRDRMNEKAAMKGKAPRAGPIMANGSFKTQQAKNIKKNKPKPLPPIPRKK